MRTVALIASCVVLETQWKPALNARKDFIFKMESVQQSVMMAHILINLVDHVHHVP